MVIICQAFTPLLKDHLRHRLQHTYPALADSDVPIVLHHDRIFKHATVHFNYTTYDLQREQDIIHPSMGKADVLVHTPSLAEDLTGRYPWSYARVLGVYHANIHTPGPSRTERVEFLHVRWFQTDTTSPSGSEARRLERINFVPWTAGGSDAFGFIDPAHVIRACHLIPAFRHQRTHEYLPTHTTYQDLHGDWKYYYVNR